MNEEEIWKDVNGFEGYYAVSNTGKIKSIPRFIFNGKGYFKTKDKIIRPVFDSCGRQQAHLHKNNIRTTSYVHRIVGKAFIPNPDNLPQINHIDGNKINNHVNNLEWCDNLYNQRHSWAIGLRKPNLGEKSGTCKLTTEDVLAIRESFSRGVRNKDLAIKYNVKRSTISAITNRINWRHV